MQSAEPRLVTGTRNGRYGEVLLAFLDDGLRLEVYNSYLLNDCPQELWEQLSAESIAAEFGAVRAVLNGPRYWLMDGIGKVDNVNPHIREFGGIAMRRAAVIEVEGPVMERVPYREVSVNRGAIWFFDAGSEIFELRAPGGRTYVMQAYCTAVDASISLENLATLGPRLNLPDGWTIQRRVLESELKIDTTQSVATVLQDEFENTYTLVA